MILSANEAASLTKLAMRGVGYSWGVSEESALVMSWLTQQKMPALQIVCDILEWTDQQDNHQLEVDDTASTFFNGSELTCPLMAGVAINDFSYRLNEGGTLQLQNVASPLLVFPFIASVSQSLDIGIRVRWSTEQVIVRSNRLIADVSNEAIVNKLGKVERVETLILSKVAPADGSSEIGTNESLTPEESSTGLHVERAGAVDSTFLDRRVCADADCLEKLRGFAHRTYAPATEQSRLAGAGAGLSDND